MTLPSPSHARTWHAGVQVHCNYQCNGESISPLKRSQSLFLMYNKKTIFIVLKPGCALFLGTKARLRAECWVTCAAPRSKGLGCWALWVDAGWAGTGRLLTPSADFATHARAADASCNRSTACSGRGYVGPGKRADLWHACYAIIRHEQIQCPSTEAFAPAAWRSAWTRRCARVRRRRAPSSQGAAGLNTRSMRRTHGPARF